MATKELQRLRLGYTAAYSAYMQCVLMISAASQRGELPHDETARAEQAAFNDLARTRHDLLDELSRHVRKK